MGFFDFITGQRKAIAISFHDDAIRAASLASTGNRVDIVYFAEQLLPAGVVERSVIADSKLFQESLRALKRSCKITTPIHLLIPEDRALTFTTKVILDPTVKMEIIIEDHLKAYIALHDTVAFEDSVCEYEVTHISDNVVEVSAVIMRQSMIRNYIELFSEVGITVATCNAPSSVFAKHGTAPIPNNATVIISLQEEGSTIVVSHNGKVYQSQYVPIGGKYLIQIIRDYVSMEYADAKKALYKHGLLTTHPDKRVHSALSHVFRPLAEAIDDMATTHLQNHSQVGAVHLYITGSYANIPGVKEYFTRMTRLEAHDLLPHHLFANKDADDMGIPVIHLDDFLKYAPTIFCAYEYVGK